MKYELEVYYVYHKRQLFSNMSNELLNCIKDYFVLENEKYYTTSSSIGYCIQFDYISIFRFTMIVIKKRKNVRVATPNVIIVLQLHDTILSHSSQVFIII